MMAFFKAKLLSTREKALCFVAAFALVGFVTNAWVFEPLWHNFKNKQKALVELTAKRSLLMGEISLEEINKGAILRAVETELALKQKLELAKASVVGKKRLNTILSLLSDSRLSSDISLLSMSISTKTVAGNFGKITDVNYKADIDELTYEVNKISLSLDTGFKSVAFLMRDLVNAPLAISISRLSLFENKKGTGLNANIELLVYTRAL